jgi:hypothetical protein
MATKKITLGEEMHFWGESLRRYGAVSEELVQLIQCGEDLARAIGLLKEGKARELLVNRLSMIVAYLYKKCHAAVVSRPPRASDSP